MSNLRFSKIFLKAVFTLTIAVLFGCSGSSSSSGATDNSNAIGVDPFAEILSYGVGSFGGDCVSLSTGRSVSNGRISLSADGLLNGQEFSSTFTKQTDTAVFTQTRNSANGSIISSESSTGKTSNQHPTDELLLRYDSSQPNSRTNESFARLEDTTNKGLSCAVSNTSQLIAKDMHINFVKYINNPKVAFTQCSCSSSAGGLPTTTPASSFSSTRTAVSVQGKSINLGQGFLEQNASYTSDTQNFIYTLQPTTDALVTYIFDQNLNLSQFSAQYDSGDSCVCH